jgi:hypothetical protein
VPLDLRGDAALFLDLDDFAEKIEVHPLRERPRVVSAIVDRNPPAPVSEAPNALAGKLTITVANDPITGIWSQDMDRATLKVKVALLDGGIQELRPLGSVEKQDAGMLTIWVL